MAGNISFHPAPGLGDLLPGFFVVPQNPIMSREGITYVPGIGDILPGSFPVPQNPVKDFTMGEVRMIGQQKGGPRGVSGCGCGCGGNGGCARGQLNGIGISGVSEDFSAFTGDITSGNIMAAFSDTILGVPVWAYLAGITLFMLAGGEKHSYAGRGRRAARAARAAF